MITKGLIAIATQGFANRLRMIVSSYIFSRFIELPLYVCWIATEECNADYSDIFDKNDFNIITLNEFEKSNYIYLGRKHTQNIIKDIINILASKEQNYEYIVLEGGHEFKHPDISLQFFLYQKHKFYKSLKFSNIIRNKVSNYVSLYNLERTIGIHYRDIINKYDDADINNSSLINFTQNSPIEKFINIISNLKNISNYDHLLVISNNPELYNVLKNYFKNKSFIKTNTKFYDRNKKDAIIDSVVDFLILSKTNMIIGTFYSSFSDEASFIDFIPKITPLSDKLKQDLEQNKLNYHCLNYTYNNIASLNYNDKIFFHLFGDGINNLN